MNDDDRAQAVLNAILASTRMMVEGGKVH
jgi:hypothetical protein